MVQQTAHKDGGQIRTQRPGRVCVAHAERKVRYIAEQYTFINERVTWIYGLRINEQANCAQGEHLQASRGYDDVGFELVAGSQSNAPFGKRVDLISNHGCATSADGPEQVGIGNEAQALIPGPVPRAKMLVD